MSMCFLLIKITWSKSEPNKTFCHFVTMICDHIGWSLTRHRKQKNIRQTSSLKNGQDLLKNLSNLSSGHLQGKLEVALELTVAGSS